MTERRVCVTRRREWLYFFGRSAICHNMNNGKNHTYEGPLQHLYEGCGSCDACWLRAIQSVIVLVACQGARDDMILPLFCYVFQEHEQYIHFSFNDWVNIPEEKLTLLYWSGSKQYLNCMIALNIIKELKKRKDEGKPISEDIEWYVKHYGIQKKTAILILTALFGYKRRFGIPTDRHVKDTAIVYEWYSDSHGMLPDKDLITSEEINTMLEYVFDEKDYFDVNEIPGALAQYEDHNKSVLNQTIREVRNDETINTEETNYIIEVFVKYRKGRQALKYIREKKRDEQTTKDAKKKLEEIKNQQVSEWNAARN
jgi:hypothetical protein